MYLNSSYLIFVIQIFCNQIISAIKITGIQTNIGKWCKYEVCKLLSVRGTNPNSKTALNTTIDIIPVSVKKKKTNKERKKERKGY